MIRLTLPYPPSMNRLWRNVAGRTLLSAHGRSYRAAVGQVALVARPVRFGGQRVLVSIRAWMPDARRRDLDNTLKAALDGLTHAGVYDDDSQIDELRITRAGIDRANPRLDVEITPA